MERKIGETFEIDGVILKVIEQPYDGHPKCPCEGCYFDDGSHKCYYPRIFNIIGKCSGRYIRNEGDNVIFIKI